MNENHCPVNIYLDLSKAFDSLYYDTLLSKLKYYGLQWKALQLIKSYISGRCQYVQLGDVKSSTHAVVCGIPQGSVLGPLLFNIYINDITKATSKFNVIMYADDTTLVSTLENFGALNNIAVIRVGVKYSTCNWYLYLSTYLSVLAVLEYLVYGNVKVLVLVLVLDQKVLGTYK